LGSFDGQKLSLVVCCGAGTNVNARELLARMLAEINGRGGGEASLAQGGGAAGEAQVSALWADVERMI
jgi:alanyl-tRNA synthetase